VPLGEEMGLRAESPESTEENRPAPAFVALGTHDGFCLGWENTASNGQNASEEQKSGPRQGSAFQSVYSCVQLSVRAGVRGASVKRRVRIKLRL
jgi:hypothetical protein